MISSLALLWNGLLNGVYGALFLTNPAILLSFFYNGDTTSISTVDPLLDSICKYFGVALCTFSFLYMHYLPFPDKQGPGLRMAMMLSAGYMLVALSKFLPETAGTEEGGAASYTSVFSSIEAALEAVGFGTAGADVVDNKKRDAAIRTLAIQGFTFAISMVGMMKAPKSKKGKKD